MPLVSVIVPVYNATATLPRCVDSVLTQTIRNLELLLVDDGSTDRSGALCDGLARVDKRIRVLHQKNSGPSAARNNGLKAASGEWVIFLDADDAMSPVLLESALAAAQNEPDRLVLWLYGDSPDSLVKKPNSEGTALDFTAAAHIQMDNLLPMPWNKLFRLSLIRSAHIFFDTRYSLGEDLLFCLDYARALLESGGKGFYQLSTPLSFYDQNVPGSLTHQVRSDYFELWSSIYDRLFELCESVFCCPAEDLGLLHRLVIQTLMAGCRDTLTAAEGPSPRQRRREVRTILQNPWLLQHVRQLADSGRFSLYEVGIRLRCPGLIRWAFDLWENDRTHFLNLQYTGEAIRQRLHPGRR